MHARFTRGYYWRDHPYQFGRDSSMLILTKPVELENITEYKSKEVHEGAKENAVSVQDETWDWALGAGVADSSL
jgi:hypothetical protein